jgi:peptide/nickel transport system permease protein
MSVQPMRATSSPSSFSRISFLQAAALLIALIYIPLACYVIAGSSLGPWRDIVLLPALPATVALYAMTIWRWRESTLAIVGLSLVFFWVAVAVYVPYLPLSDPNKPVAPFVMPFSERSGVYYLLGTDMRGRDMLSRTLWGVQRVLIWGLTATTAAYVVGAMLGLIAGYLGGWWDTLVSFFCNVLISFPVMVLLILILNVMGQSGINIIVAVTVASAPGIMRIVRGLTLDAKTRDYIFAAQTRGESSLRIMLVEILPNVRGPLIVDACLRLGYTTVAITTLTFLGLGLQPPDPDWGLMIKEAASAALLWKFAYMMIVPAASVSSLILGFNLLADGIREMSLRD